ncbi:DUF6233 domain-containing protein [Streptomyces sp. NPDC056121]|uniref:DUF6233 domain-containing protein n=1 Tax=unclassified Streptomyces TaxID=2593676 RepID=UPI0035D8F1B8
MVEQAGLTHRDGPRRPRPRVRPHAGGCHVAGKRSRGVDRDQAPRAITEGVPACTRCRPDTEHGILE